MNIVASKKVQKLTASIFQEVADLKRQALNRGLDVIDLSVGSPDLPPPAFVVEELVKYTSNTANYGYTLKGIPEFHEAVSFFYKQRYAVDIDPEKKCSN